MASPLFDFYIFLANFLGYSRNTLVRGLENVIRVWIDCTQGNAAQKKSVVFDCNFLHLDPYKSCQNLQGDGTHLQ